MKKNNTNIPDKQRNIGSLVKKYSIILIFSIVYAIGISLFLAPNELAPGGISGISIIVSHYTGISNGLLYFILNIPIMILGVYKLGIKFLSSTIVTVILTSFFVDIFEAYSAFTTNKMLAAIIGGAVVATGLGMIFKTGATSGGADIIVRLLKLKYPHIETGKLFLAMDSIIVLLSAIAFKNVEAALYAGIAVFVSSNVMDKVLYGTDGAKLVFIISDSESEIAHKLLKDIDTGVTFINGSGAYTSADKKIIMCVSKKQNLPKIQNVVRDIDSNAFMIISSASEVVGKGYKSPFQEKL